MDVLHGILPSMNTAEGRARAKYVDMHLKVVERVLVTATNEEIERYIGVKVNWPVPEDSSLYRESRLTRRRYNGRELYIVADFLGSCKCLA